MLTKRENVMHFLWKGTCMDNFAVNNTASNLSDFALFLTVMKHRKAYQNTSSIILDIGIQKGIEMDVSKEEAKNNIMKKFDLTPEKAAEYIDQYWSTGKTIS